MQNNYKYKDSGIEWLGEIPSHWNVKRLKRVCAFAYGDSLPDDNRNDGQIPVYGSNGIVGFHDENNTLSPSIVVGRKGSYGKLNYSLDKAFAIDTTYYIDANTTAYDIRWLYYALLCLKLDQGSKDSAVPGLAREDAYKHFLPDCNLLEQQAIVSFLDRETSRIDALIQKKERLIELLKEKRIALITQAVTKGLDPNVPMKDSGIEWLGEVPEHWEMTRLRYCIRLNPSKKEITHFPKDTEVSFLPMENVGEDGSLDLSETRAISEVDTGYTFFGENDVAIAKITPCFENGKGCVFRNLENGYGFGSTELTVMRPIDLIPDLLYFLTISTYFRKIGEALMQGSAGQKRVPDDYIRNLYIGLPTIEEQQQIVCYVHEKLRSNEALIGLTSLSIDKLREYRSSLINAAVTGKIDLREAL